MKMVKSLLLGSAAGLVAVVGAQAADLPVKAKPVEYVKVCSLYGAGFYYIPGTDICMKIGGFVQYQAAFGYGGSLGTGPLGGFNSIDSRFANAPATNNGNDFVQRVRAVVTTDTRAQTAYGTVRTYFMMGMTSETSTTSTLASAPPTYSPRAFIQWAGFTFGRAQSFYDLFSGGAVSYGTMISGDTGASGNLLAAYTWQFGGGVSATVAIEEGRRSPGGILPTNSLAVTTIGTTDAVFLPITASPNAINVRYPDLVANLRVDQAWGSWQVMGALHDASVAYYMANVGTGATAAAGVSPNLALGAPADKIGFAVGTGASINTSFISPGDRFQFQVNYTEGALRYLAGAYGSLGGAFGVSGQNSLGYGLFLDGVVGAAGTSIDLTKAWHLNASYEHLWTPNLKTSIYGSYLSVQYSANANAGLCGSGTGTTNNLFRAGSVCNNDWNIWEIGSRTQWNIRPDFYMGVDFAYRKLETASAGALLGATVQPRPANTTYVVQDQDVLSAIFRVQRDIVP